MFYNPMKRCSTSLVIRDVQIKISVRYHFRSTGKAKEKKRRRITNIGNNVEKLEPSCVAGGRANGAVAVVKEFGNSSKHRITM